MHFQIRIQPYKGCPKQRKKHTEKRKEIQITGVLSIPAKDPEM